MELNEYQKIANTFATENLPDEYAFTNGMSELGEIMGKFAKFQRKHGVSFEVAIDCCRNPIKEDEIQLRKDVEKELGDLLWQVQRMVTVCRFDLAGLARDNIQKLTDRKERNVIDGEGDYR